MVSKILLFVGCASLLLTSQGEAQIFSRFRVQPQPQPQRYAPSYPQNGYQGRLTAAQPRQPIYVRRADGSVVRYYPNNNVQQSNQVRNYPQPRRIGANTGQPTQIRNSNTRRVPDQITAAQSTPKNTNPTLSGDKRDTAANSISPAISMPEASMDKTAADTVVSIPVSDRITNAAPQGLSLYTASDDVVRASADVPAQVMPAKAKTFSVLEFIE